MSVTNATLVKVSFDADRWRRRGCVSGIRMACRSRSRMIRRSGCSRAVAGRSRNPLQVAVARLLGFRWPDQEPDDLDASGGRGRDRVPSGAGWGDHGGGAAANPSGHRLRRRSGARSCWTRCWSEAGAKPGTGLEKWLRDGFFKDHCKVFANRPFIWQIWDGRPDGFSALVNYHKLDRKLLESLTYNYLGSWWIGRLNDELTRQDPGSGGAPGCRAGPEDEAAS